MVTAVSAAALAFPAFVSTVNATSPTVNWISWTDPGDFPGIGSLPQSPDPNYDFTYASIATGALSIPGGSTVYVRFNGEVAVGGGDPSAFGVSGSSYWSGRPSTSGGTYISSNVPTLPPDSDRIGVVGSSVAAQSLTFYSDAARTTPVNVSNIVMNIYSLGAPSSLGAWDFNQSFSILSDNRTVDPTYGFAKSAQGSGVYRLSASEGSGTIQFVGTFNTISWTVTQPEAFATWNIGVTSEDPPFDVTLDTQGGSPIAAQATSVGGSLDDPGTPTRDGYTFAGWFTQSRGGTPITFPYAHGQTGAFTLYAQWTGGPSFEYPDIDIATWSNLPDTGRESTGFVTLALLLLATGSALMFVAQRRSQQGLDG